MSPVKGLYSRRHLSDGYRIRKPVGSTQRGISAQQCLLTLVALAIFFIMMSSFWNDTGGVLREVSHLEVVQARDSFQAKIEEKNPPSPLITLLPRNAFNSVDSEHKLRRQQLSKVCREHASELKMLYTWRYKYDRKHAMLYCPVPKTGWSSWKRVLFYINGVIKSMDVEIGITPDRKANVMEMTGYSIVRANRTGTFHPFSFVFVRNPWERLVSAYINKALDWNYTRILHTPCEWESMTPYRPPITFVQFLSCIVGLVHAKKKLDMHWVPTWQLCDFCQISYDAIGHMESIDADAKYVIERTALNIEFPRIFSSRSHNTSDVLHSWYSTVPPDVLQELRKLYKLDFLLHGYSDIPPGWEGKL